MSSLEEEIESLTQLDEYRIQSAKRRDDGRKALTEWPDPWGDVSAPVLERALAVRAIDGHASPQGEQRIHEAIALLAGLPTSEMFSSKPDEMPVLRAARAMHALVNSNHGTFSRVVLCCYYRLVREIYSAHPPEWVTGGTRAGEETAATAYATGETVRAILGFIRALERRVQYVGAIRELQKKWTALEQLKQIPPDWRAIETSRLAREFRTTIETEKGNGGLVTDIPLDGSPLTLFVTAILERMRKVVDETLTSFTQARTEIRAYRTSEIQRDEKGRDRWRLSQTAHLIAMAAVDRALATTKRILELLDLAIADKGRLDAHLENVQKEFAEAARRTRKLVQPAISYLARILDRELAAAASDDKVNCDTPELAFAAASYGAATAQWHDERLRRATSFLIAQMSERGRFPLGRPLRANPKGYKAHAIGSEVLRALSQLLEHITSVELAPRIVKSMMMYFDDTAVPERPGVWQYDEPAHSTHPPLWGTAFAILALDRINRMLDARINVQVLRHFSWHDPSPAGLKLADLFYGDYGLVTQKIVERDSIAIILEQVRAHVRGFRGESNPYSLVLHGPPGTGKTTLVEALANSSQVRLVEVTPSDIVLAGADQVERRARAVFKALSLLTRVVIMFDEFDPVLQKRVQKPERPPDVFSFLTPGMLPKLKTLHEAAKKRSFAYVMLTNLIGTLDEAAIRDGRFDLRVGIYPPDLLSRIGRLYSITERRVAAREPKTVGKPRGDEKIHLTGKEAARDAAIRSVIINTAGISMDTLGKRGWYTPPGDSDDKSSGTAFEYIESKPALRRPFHTPYHIAEAEKRGDNDYAIDELLEWRWVREWDKKAKRLESEPIGPRPSIADLLAAAPPKPQRPAASRRRATKSAPRPAA